MRVSVEWRSASKENYKLFCKDNPNIKLSYTEWSNIIYSYNELYRDHILETGEREKMPMGFGEFSITKKKRKRIFVDSNGNEHINLPIDWKKSKEKGKIIYNFNYHTDGYFFGWVWFKKPARFKHSDLWFFKPSRVTSRLLKHYLTIEDRYQHTYREWKNE